MDKGVKESIQKFENKKEFHEVKLKTSKSFREDKEALDQRLEKYRNMSTSVMSGTTQHNGDGEDNGSVASNEISNITSTNEPSSIESIVVELNQNDASDKQSSDVLVNNTGNNNEHANVALLEKKEHAHTNGHKLQTEGTQPRKNGTVPDGKPQVDLPPTQVLNGKPPTAKLPMQVLNGHLRGSMTPEPRIKYVRGIYEKNPKLTATSTDHLDNISLKGPHGNHVQMQKAVIQKPVVYNQAVPVVPSAAVTSIPADGNLYTFSVEQMVTVFRLLQIPEDLLSRLHRGKVDGKRFSVFTDKELGTLGMKNPIITYFRDKSVSRAKQKPKFML